MDTAQDLLFRANSLLDTNIAESIRLYLKALEIEPGNEIVKHNLWIARNLYGGHSLYP